MSSTIFAQTKDPDTKRADAVIAQIKKDEEELQLASFTPDDAWEIGSAIRNKFLEVQREAPSVTDEDVHNKRYGHVVYHKFPAGSGIVIRIETFTGLTLFSATAGPPVSKPGNERWIDGKINIARANHRSSFGVGREWSRRDRDPADMGFPFPEYAPYGGAFPIWIRGVTVAPVAVIVVSGLSQDQDHQLIVDTLREYIGQKTPPGASQSDYTSK